MPPAGISTPLIGVATRPSYGIPAVVTSISPTSGSHTGGTSVTLHGTGFLNCIAALVGGVKLTSFVVVDDNTITGVTGAGAAGAVDVVARKISRTPTDTATDISWSFDASTPPYANEGHGGSCDLTVSFSSGDFTPNIADAPFGKAVDAAPAGTCLATFGASSVVPSGSAFSIHGWYKRHGAGSGSPILVGHSFGSSWPTGGKYGNGIVISAGAVQPGFYLVGSGVVFMNAPSLPLDEWAHVACTYDSTTLTTYINGVSVGTPATAPGAPIAVDWNPSGGGVWQLLGNAILHGGDTFDGRADDVRVESVCRSGAYMNQLATQGPVVLSGTLAASFTYT